MRRHTFVVTLAAGALALGACKKEEPIRGNPPAPEPPPISTNPPATPTGGSTETPASTLPTWDEVPSGHPEGATNPPIPHLVVKPDGSCFKLWVSPMKRLEPGKTGDYVDTECVAEACGTPIQCPPERAGAVLLEWAKEKEPEAE